MMTALLTGAALLPGYLVAVALLMIVTFAITLRTPAFAVHDFRIRGRYKLVHNLAWLVCAAAGGYVTAMMTQIVGVVIPWLPCAVLAIVMILVLWSNSWEMRQRGIAHQILMSIVSVAGVAAGYVLQMPKQH
jgi:hypothetical protein